MVDILAILAFLLPVQAYLALGFHSIYKSIEEEKEIIEKERRRRLDRNVRFLSEQIRKILASNKNLTYMVAVVTILALLAWAVDHVVISEWIFPVWPFSLALSETLVLFFTIETLYQLTLERVLSSLLSNPFFKKILTVALFTGSLMLSVGSTVGCIFSEALSCAVEGYVNDLAFYLFFLILFVTGLGAIGIVNTISNTLSSKVPSEKRSRIKYHTTLTAGLVILYLILAETPQLGPTGLYGLVGLELAALSGLGYSLASFLRRRAIHSTALVYLILMFALSGLFLGYNPNTQNPPNLNSTSLSLAYSARSLAVSFTLFILGYVTILFQLPRKFERKFRIKRGQLAPYLTFLLIFTALATFQLAYFSYGPGLFIYEKETPIFLGLVVGGIIFTTDKTIKAHERKNPKPPKLTLFCDRCWSLLESSTRFCENCGAAVSTTTPDKVLFLGAGQLIETLDKRHSTSRKAGSLIVGGPIGYLAFGRDLGRKVQPEGQLAVTNRALYIDREFFPISRISSVRYGHYSDLLILDLKENPHSSSNQQEGNQDHAIEVELRTRNAESVSKCIQQAKSQPRPSHPHQ